jgi:hypothetical protein
VRRNRVLEIDPEYKEARKELSDIETVLDQQLDADEKKGSNC